MNNDIIYAGATYIVDGETEVKTTSEDIVVAETIWALYDGGINQMEGQFVLDDGTTVTVISARAYDVAKATAND